MQINGQHCYTEVSTVFASYQNMNLHMALTYSAWGDGVLRMVKPERRVERRIWNDSHVARAVSPSTTGSAHINMNSIMNVL